MSNKLCGNPTCDKLYVKTKICLACFSNYPSIQKYRYCSVQCQKEDWVNHKKICLYKSEVIKTDHYISYINITKSSSNNKRKRTN